MKYYLNNSLTTGNTPLVRLNNINNGAEIYAKIESRNPSFSVKCRTARSMIEDAETKGLLKKGVQIIEPTSGNTGIALAYIAAAKGYRLHLTMPETMSLERRKLIASFGANLILTDGAKGMKGAIEKANEIKGSDPDNYFIPDQFSNPANPLAHRLNTGREIWEDTDGKVDAVVSGIGTGGTITGIAQHIKLDRGKKISCIGVEPAESPVISQYLAGEELKPGPHKIQGIGAGFIPDTLDLKFVDRIITVTGDEAFEYARLLAKKEGIIVGISSGAAMAAAVKISAEPEFANKKIVVILPDSGERYLSSTLFENPG